MAHINVSRVGGRTLGLACISLALLSGSAAAGAPAAVVSPAEAGSRAVTASAAPGVIGARTVGDPFYPTLGNGGYDVRDYELDLTWHVPDTVRPAGWIEGVATIGLVPDVDLAEFSLDLTRANTRVLGVAIEGRPVAHRADGFGRKLIVTPETALPAGFETTLSVSWTATPMGVNKLGEELPLEGPGASGIEALQSLARGFLSDSHGGFFMASQPNGAHSLFPANDTPIDKAPVTVRLTAPAGMLGVATGTRVEQTANEDGTTTTTWASLDPVATHVLAMGVGRWSVLESDLPGAPHQRSSVPTELAALTPLRLGVLGAAVSWLEGAIGRPYPFRSLGFQLVAPGSTDAILEGQTLILAGAGMLDPRVSDCDWRGLVVHETAHQWFGDSVSLLRWDQKWLSEGHATFYERLYDAASGCDALGLAERMRRIYEHGQSVRDRGGPPDRPRAPRYAYDSTIYDQGALALYALRQQVGATVFRDIETAWLDRFAGDSASTDDFISLASQVAGTDLSRFLEDWLRSDTLPPMPGHPDWASPPLPTGSAAPAASAAP